MLASGAALDFDKQTLSRLLHLAAPAGGGVIVDFFLADTIGQHLMSEFITGYTLLRDEKHDETIAVFALNVKLFSESANTYDSLGEAYMESGRTQQAIESYQKTLELDPDSENAKRMLKRLRKTE